MLIQKITPAELLALNTKPQGKSHAVRAAIQNLQKGEIIRINRKAFTWKRQTPARFCNEISKQSKKRFRVLKEIDNTGWVVERVL